MSSLLQLAADLLDRMSNPSYGASVNEEYAQRFAAIMVDGELDDRLIHEAGELRDPRAFTAAGWLWLLGWVKASEIRLDDQLLTGLCEQWEAASFKALVIEHAIAHLRPAHDDPYRERQFSDDPDQFEPVLSPEQRQEAAGGWLSDLVQRASAEPSEVAPADEPRSEPDRAVFARHSHHAESLLMALLLVDQPATIAAAEELLAQDWRGSEQLAQSLEGWLSTLDAESAELWRRRLHRQAGDDH